MSPITTFALVVQGASFLAAVIAFAFTRRRGASRVGFALLIWLLAPTILATGGLLLVALAGWGTASQANRYDRQWNGYRPYTR